MLPFWRGHRGMGGEVPEQLKLSSVSTTMTLAPVDSVTCCQSPLRLAHSPSGLPLVRSCEPRLIINTEMVYQRRCCIWKENPGWLWQTDYWADGWHKINVCNYHQHGLSLKERFFVFTIGWIYSLMYSDFVYSQNIQSRLDFNDRNLGL